MIRSLRKLYWWLFSYIHPALQILHRNCVKNLLDVGSGVGGPVRALKCYKVGLDISLLALRRCLKEHTHTDLVLGSASHIPFRDKCFDAVICLQTLHLLPKHNGQTAIGEMERVAYRLVVLAMAIGQVPEGNKDGWKSLWEPEELVAGGYFVEFYGLRFLHRLALRRSETQISKFIFSIDPFINILQRLLPRSVKHYMVCHKYLRD